MDKPAGGVGEYRRRWYPLDNTAVIFPPIISSRFTTVFRVSAVLDHPVRLAILQKAVHQFYARLPYFCVRLRSGLFWYYLEETDPAPPLRDDRMPCMTTPHHNGTLPLALVRVRWRRITVEVSHALTDGSGALAALKALLVMYFSAGGGTTGISAAELHESAGALGILRAGETPAPWEERYASRELVAHGYAPPRRMSRAWHVEGSLLPPGEYCITSIRYPVPAIREVARSLGGSITDLAIALLIHSLHERYRKRWRRRKERFPVRILVPVDMRPHTGLQTMRNFFVPVMVELDQRLGTYSMEEIVPMVHHQLRAALDPPVLQRFIHRNVAAERNWFNRLMPIGLKREVLRLMHRWEGEQANTASFSNLGVVALPNSIKEHVPAMDFIPPPSPITRINCTALSCGDTLSFTFGSLLQDRGIERSFATLLAGYGVTGSLVTNYPSFMEAP
jgi:NRPS condensation-like uncharacterized protein